MRLLRLISVTAMTITVIAYAQESRPVVLLNGEPIAKPQAAGRATRFTYVDVYVDSGDKPLAAYQVRIDTRAAGFSPRGGASAGADVKIVGIEGGAHAAFANPPYYDPAAMMNDRVIIAAFNTGRDLPTGKTRVARLHVMIAGDGQPEYSTKLDTAATTDGKQISATVSLEQGAHS